MDSAKPRMLIQLDQLCSKEYFEDSKGNQRQVLKDITMTGYEQQTWGIYSTSAFEMRLLLDIIANLKPYQKGKCVLGSTGMYRKKRIILPHVYVIGSTGILYEHMNVLEYLVLLNSKSETLDIKRKRLMLEDLLQAGLGSICLSKIKYLSPQEKALVCLFSSLYLQSEIIILNLGRIQYDKTQLSIFFHIAKRLREQNKILLFASQDFELLELCTTHLLMLKDGKQKYCGLTSSLLLEHQYHILQVKGADIGQLSASLYEALPSCRLEVNGSLLDIFMKTDDKPAVLDQIYAVFQQHHFYPELIKTGISNLKFSWEEVM